MNFFIVMSPMESDDVRRADFFALDLTRSGMEHSVNVLADLALRTANFPEDEVIADLGEGYEETGIYLDAARRFFTAIRHCLEECICLNDDHVYQLEELRLITTDILQMRLSLDQRYTHLN